MKPSHNLLTEITTLYENLPLDISIEKEIEILNLLLRFYKENKTEIPEKLINSTTKIIKVIFNNIIGYITRNDIESIKMAVESINYIGNIDVVKNLSIDFIKNINANWNNFHKDSDIIILMFVIAQICERNSIIELREDFVRMFLNTLLELKDNHLLKLNTTLNVAKYLKDINMLDQSKTLLTSELKLVPLKTLIASFKDIIAGLEKYNLLSEEVKLLLLEIIKKSVPVQYYDDVIVHILNAFYDNKSNEEIVSFISQFNDINKSYLFILDKIESEKCFLNEDSYKKRLELFNLIYNNIKHNNKISFTLLSKALSLKKFFKLEGYDELLNELLIELKNQNKVNPNNLCELIANLL